MILLKKGPYHILFTETEKFVKEIMDLSDFDVCYIRDEEFCELVLDFYDSSLSYLACREFIESRVLPFLKRSYDIVYFRDHDDYKIEIK